MQEILKVSSIKKTFLKDGESNTVINDVSFTVKKGQCVGIVGESGCGKSTTARIILGLLNFDEGEIILSENKLSPQNRIRLKEIQGKIQMVFQMPTESFNPRIKLGKSIKEAMRKTLTSEEKEVKLKKLFEECQLSYDLADRYPKEVSGGQCQRAAIARALASDPQLLICDEATSALDVTVQYNIMNLLKNIQKNRDMAILFICHDIALVQQFCDYVLVMDKGKIIEEGIPNEVILNPSQMFTQKLISSVI
ncbi:ABC transporter ATP-binding protein [uncultured Clostridium sp.]|uniref:ABC transporter ATP-binding protein n=1 Tax=uncultured Clostridium sp. TaxID=59620 RepID=UPI00266F022E|nr:dipeptide/oligopeptide/nickel ABC transporter ATP-binding protein [uncultured Clostridium sp.]